MTKALNPKNNIQPNQPELAQNIQQDHPDSVQRIQSNQSDPTQRTQSDQPELARRKQRMFLAIAVFCVIFAATVFCAFEIFQSDQYVNSEITSSTSTSATSSAPNQNIPLRFGYLVFVCLLTAVIEEIIFRGIFLRALFRAFSPTVAIIVTSGVFALLHAFPFGVDVFGSSDFGADAFISNNLGTTTAINLSIGLSLFLKFLQAFVFGLIMAGIVTRGGNLIIAIAVHALFDVIYFSVAVMSTGDFPASYVMNSPEQFIGMLFSITIMTPALILEFRTPTSPICSDAFVECK